MAERNFPNWIDAFIEYSQSGECPNHILHWVAISSVASAMAGKTWFNMGKFIWLPNFYVVVVAPPGVISKSITTGTSMDLLREVPEVKWGPSVVTMQALLKRLNKFEEDHILPDGNGKHVAKTMSPMTIFSGELGNLIAPNDREMLDMLTNLWDGTSFTKETLKDGSFTIKNPCLNLIGCTTPEWVSTSFPMYMIGSGLISRIVFVYGDDKRQAVAYPFLQENADHEADMKPKLIEDLKSISELKGPFNLTKAAAAWGTEWYLNHVARMKANNDTRYGGFFSRKQAHIHKLAMVLSAARSDSLVLTLDDLQDAERMVTGTEVYLSRVFDLMGKTEQASHADRLVNYIASFSDKGIGVEEAYRFVHNYFPKSQDFSSIIEGLKKSGLVKTAVSGGKVVLVATGKPA